MFSYCIVIICDLIIPTLIRKLEYPNVRLKLRPEDDDSIRAYNRDSGEIIPKSPLPKSNCYFRSRDFGSMDSGGKP